MEAFFSDRSAYFVLGISAMAVPAAAVMIAYFWYKLRREDMLVALKRELAEHGMTADEIRAVIEASPPGMTSVAEDLAAFNGDAVRTGVQDPQPRRGVAEDLAAPNGDDKRAGVQDPQPRRPQPDPRRRELRGQRRRHGRLDGSRRSQFDDLRIVPDR